MSPRHLPGPTALLAAAVLASLAVAVPIAPASADEATDAPVTRPDRVTLRGGGVALVDVLRNDVDPNGDELQICRTEVPDGVPINDGRGGVAFGFSGTSEPAPLLVQSSGYGPGTYTITYYACDHDYLTPGQVTVVVKRTRPVRARKVAPHVVRFVNPDDRPVRVHYYSPFTDNDVEGTVRLAPGAAARVRVDGRSIFWDASPRRDAGEAGHGRVGGLDRP
jgi:hypothetical protein